MLDHEYSLLVERLDATRGGDTRFFVFADTVAARNFEGTNECHGWIGLRYQARPRGAPNDLLLHVNLRDGTNLGQQQALGVLGVNILYAAFKKEGSAAERLADLLADLALERIEIDVLEAHGPDLHDPGPAVIGRALVRGGLAHAVMVGDADRLLPPTEVLRKRPIILERCRARGAAPGDAFAAARALLKSEGGDSGEHEPLLLRELAVVAAEGTTADAQPAPIGEEALAWIARERRQGDPLALTRFEQPFALTAYLRRYTQEPIRFILPVTILKGILLTVAKEGLDGGLLEGLGRLLAANVRIYTVGAGADSAREMSLPAPVGHLYTYLLEAGWVIPLA
jgi:hypothetical protein